MRQLLVLPGYHEAGAVRETADRRKPLIACGVGVHPDVVGQVVARRVEDLDVDIVISGMNASPDYHEAGAVRETADIRRMLIACGVGGCWCFGSPCYGYALLG
ncbi:MAG: hypothetical protein ACETWM_21465 [Candidatus Lokiarchaeia archaeon]